MKKYIAIAVIILIIIGFFLFRRPPAKVETETPANQNTNLSQTSTFPAGWTIVSESDTTVKLEKIVTSGLKPEVIFKVTTSKDAVTPAKYVDNLKAGARATLPGLVYLTDKRNSQESAYTAFLTGYYFNQGKKIFVDQRLYIQGETVNTFTGSSDSNLTEEVSQILSSLSQEKIGQ
ncbi:MAG: hypothetical protein NTY75_01495 [Candidatus Shapirobacteria bacterium]|nr:hypothetical protein [Candidatus Shapirobacteria bacterium]